MLDDPELARIEGRIETDRHGQIIMTPPQAPTHGIMQAEIGFHLFSLMNGRVITVCPISTADGVKTVDVAWASRERMAELENRSCFPNAPEICVEVMSPRNTKAEIQEKIALYFDAGAKEVWVCEKSGAMKFLTGPTTPPLPRSKLCPRFPVKVALT